MAINPYITVLLVTICRHFGVLWCRVRYVVISYAIEKQYLCTEIKTEVNKIKV